MNFSTRIGILTIVGFALTSPASAAPATGWVVTNWAFGDPTTLPVSDANTNSPSAAPATGVSLLAGFPSIGLEDNQSIRGTGLMTIAGGDGFPRNFFQFRIGLFREDGSAPTTGDGVGYTGFTIENEGFLKETAGATNPFSTGGSVLISNGIEPEGDRLEATDFTASFSLNIRRDGNAFEIEGTISDGDEYHEFFSASDYLPADADFSFNRIGFLVGNLPNADSVALQNVQVSVVPEPMTMLPIVLAWGWVWVFRESWGPGRPGDRGGALRSATVLHKDRRLRQRGAPRAAFWVAWGDGL